MIKERLEEMVDELRRDLDTTKRLLEILFDSHLTHLKDSEPAEDIEPLVKLFHKIEDARIKRRE